MSLLDLSRFPVFLNAAVFIGCAALIAAAGWHLAGVAATIARRTGLGEALTGAIFLGATTSLSGTVTSVTAAAEGYPQLAFANAIGGIAAQTMFLAIADVTYARANLEHAAASIANMMQAGLLLTMLALVVLGMASAPVTVFGLHPISLALPAVYWFGMRLVAKAQAEPMWRPQRTAETREDEPSGERRFGGLTTLWARFAGLALVVALAGLLTARSGIALAQQTGLSETAVGAAFTAVSTSLPELVTCLAAVRQGALTLAVGDIIGGNVFDTLFVTLSDAAYRDGSILHAVGQSGLFVVALSMVLAGVLLMGLLRRERSGLANIGFESILVLALYFTGIGAMLLDE